MLCIMLVSSALLHEQGAVGLLPEMYINILLENNTSTYSRYDTDSKLE